MAPAGPIRRIAVALVHDSSVLGGAETSVVAWLQRFDRERVAPSLFTFEEIGGVERPFLRYLANRDLTAHMLPWGRRKRLAAAVRQLAHALSVSQPCVVHTHGVRSDLVGYLAARLVGVPVMASNHAWHGIWPGIGAWMRAREALRARLLRRFDLLVDVSQWTREQSVLRGIDPARIVTVHTGIDLDALAIPTGRDETRERLGFASDDVVVGTVARLSPEKGHANLLRAFAAVRHRIPRARVLLVGDGTLGRGLRADAARLGISDRVTFLGFQDEIEPIYAALDVFAFPSFAEGAPLALYMAMAAALPIVASDVGAVGEMLGPGDAGLRIAPGDVNALSHALLTLCKSDSGPREALGQRALQAIRTEPRFWIDTSTRRLEAIYEMLVQRRSARGER